MRPPQFTAGPDFPPLFAEANRAAHSWLFSDAASPARTQWVVDLAPMLNDSSLQQMLEQSQRDGARDADRSADGVGAFERSRYGRDS